MDVNNAPAQFQHLMEWILNHRPGPVVDGVWTGIHDPHPQASIYIDNLIIGPVDAITYYQAFRQVLERLRAWKMVYGLNGNNLFVMQVEFFGQVLSNGTRRPAPGAMKALNLWERRHRP